MFPFSLLRPPDDLCIGVKRGWAGRKRGDRILAPLVLLRHLLPLSISYLSSTCLQTCSALHLCQLTLRVVAVHVRICGSSPEVYVGGLALLTLKRALCWRNPSSSWQSPVRFGPLLSDKVYGSLSNCLFCWTHLSNPALIDGQSHEGGGQGKAIWCTLVLFHLFLGFGLKMGHTSQRALTYTPAVYWRKGYMSRKCFF